MQETDRARRLALIRNSTAIAMATLLAACGGGAVNGPATSAPPASVPAPTPAPAPAPAPTPTPTGAASGAEYQASGAVVLAKAAFAYDRGITGKGMTIAVIDSGINRSTPEFSGRISADSTGFEQKVARCGTCAPETVPPYSIDDRDGHGTEVASIAAAARNGSGPQGVAPDATILALKISGADVNGLTEGSTAPVPESNQPNTALIAPAIRYAVDHGAFVTVMSINGFATGQIASDQHNAMDAVRTADRLFVESVSNETGKDSFGGQFAQNLVGSDLANKDWFLFAIGVDQNGNPRTENGNAGVLADRMLTAAGNNVLVVDKDGRYANVTGNSFAAPAVAGAAALLKQYWPQLGGKAISRILLDTATDAGAPGIDAVFGAGILNVEKAMQAQAPAASFAAADAVLARYSSLIVSAPFGGPSAASAIGSKTGGMIVFDRYGRDFRMEGRAGLRVAGSGLLSGAGFIQSDHMASVSTIDRRLGIASDLVRTGQLARTATPAVISFSPADGHTASIASNVAVDTGSTGMGSALRAVVSSPLGTSASWSKSGWSLGFSSARARDAGTSLRTASLGLPGGFGLEVADIDERGSVLGLRLDVESAALTAHTSMATLSARGMVMRTLLSVRGSVTTTRVKGGFGLLRFDGPLTGAAFSAEGSRIFLGGVATIGVSSPLRVERARTWIEAPESYDLISGSLVTALTAINLTPDAREMDLAFRWSTTFASQSSLRFGIVRSFDAGHVRGASDIAGFVNLYVH